MKAHCLPFAQIPHTTRLFNDFLAYSSKVQPFYPRSPHFEEWVKEESRKMTKGEWQAVLTLIVVSALIILFWAIYEQQGDAMQIYVVGKQWMWKLQHMEGQREINELHIPLGRPVRPSSSAAKPW